MTPDEEDRQQRLWWRFSEEERALRIVLAVIEYNDKTHSQCIAEANAQRPLHVTVLWEDKPFGFALKLEGGHESTWIVKLLPNGDIFDVVLVPWDPAIPSRGVLLRTNLTDDAELRDPWLGAFHAFLHQRGLMPEAPGAPAS